MNNGSGFATCGKAGPVTREVEAVLGRLHLSRCRERHSETTSQIPLLLDMHSRPGCGAERAEGSPQTGP